jgi:hypothetical protein
MVTEQDRARIAAQQTKSFLDENFGQLDLSGSPSLQPLPNETFQPSDAKGFNNVVVTGTNLLKQLADNPDAEILERIAEETGDPDLVEKIRKDREGDIAEEFVRTHKSYYPTDYNYRRIREYLDEHKQDFTAASVDAAFKFLSRTGQLETRPGQAKRLDESELLYVISLVKSGQLADAISQYLEFALPNADETWDDQDEFLSDPRTVAVRNEAVRYVWFHSQPFDDTPEFRAFEKSYFRLRPLRSYDDYVNCYALFDQQQRSIQRDEMIRGTEPAPVTPEALDSLTDDQVNSLTAQTIRQRAQQLIRERKRR